MVDFNLLSDPRDLERMMDGVRRFGAMHLTPTMQAVTTDPFPASYSDKVRQVGLVSKKNKWLTDALAKALDGPAALRSYLIRNLIMEGFTLEGLLRDDEQLEAFVRKAAVGVWHASCTCRMGSEDDPMAVTDPAGRVRAVDGLRVVDASIFPVVPCANTNFPVLMTAEKCADAMLAGVLSRNLPPLTGSERSADRRRGSGWFDPPPTDATGDQQNCQHRQQDHCGEPVMMRTRTAEAPVSHGGSHHQQRHRSNRPRQDFAVDQTAPATSATATPPRTSMK